MQSEYKWCFTKKANYSMKLHYKPHLVHNTCGLSLLQNQKSIAVKEEQKTRKLLIGWLVEEIGRLVIVGLWEGHKGGWWVVISQPGLLVRRSCLCSLVTSLRQARVVQSVRMTAWAWTISCDGHQGAAQWNVSACTWAFPFRACPACCNS